MSIKKMLTGLAGVLAIMMVMSVLDVFAEFRNETKPIINTVNEIVVELKDDRFNPNVITISNGEETKLRLKNVGVKEHTFTVEQLGIDVEVQSGKEQTITVKPEKAGTYKLICRYHERAGMVGEVIVE